MAERPSRSFATRLVLSYVGAAVGLLLLLGCASTLFTFEMYSRASNEVIASATRTLERRLADYKARGVPLTRVAAQLTADIDRPRIRVAAYDESHRLLSESTPAHETSAAVDAIASLMKLHNAEIAVPRGRVVVRANLENLRDTLRAYWALMLPTGAIAIVLAWLAGWIITRRAVLPLAQISAAMRRFARGDFSPEPVRSTRNDEIGELAHSYNGALHQVNSALAQRDRTEAEIRQFIADAGHELRTPLTVIMGYLDVLEDGAVDAPGIRERVFTTLRQESRRMRSLIEKLIFLARLEREESTTREIVDVSAVVARVAASLAPPDAPARIAVSTVSDASVVADESDIFEVVRNLIDNALKYAPGSEVAVSTTLDGDGGDVVLVVCDRGPGMSEHDRAHAFDRFYRGRRLAEVEGSGLGLAIVKRAVQRCRGTISLESGEGEGTQVTIRLPRETRVRSNQAAAPYFKSRDTVSPDNHDSCY